MCVCVLEWSLEHNASENFTHCHYYYHPHLVQERGLHYSSEEENQLHNSNPGHICRLICVGSLTIHHYALSSLL